MSRKTPDTTKPAASITPEALQAMFDSMAELRQTVAKYEAEAVAVTKAMTDGKAANGKAGKVVSASKTSMAGKTDQQIKNEIAAVKAFHRAGFKDAKPHINIKTFNRWMLENRRPVEGSKCIKTGGLRLFHLDQTRLLTSEELKVRKDQPAAAAKRQAKGTVTPLHPAN